MIVVDNTVLVDFWVGEPLFQERSKELFRMDSDWMAPSLWQYEFGYVMSKYARLDHFSEEMKLFAWEKALRMVSTVNEVDMLEVDRVALESGLKFYDASYVWLARSMGVEFYTRDKQILRECSDVSRVMPSLG